MPGGNRRFNGNPSSIIWSRAAPLDSTKMGAGANSLSHFRRPQPRSAGRPVDVWWTCDTRRLPPRRVAQCEDVAAVEARRLGMACVVIRKENHDTVLERDPVTQARTGRKLESDPHMTLFLGRSTQLLVLQGHLYVEEGDKGRFRHPVARMAEGERQIVFEDMDEREAPVSEYWGMNGSCGWASEVR
jgi:hypothetical protein